MLIDHPNLEAIPALRQLWQFAFGDPDAFLDRFFALAFAPDRSLCAWEADQLLGAVYWFDCHWEGRSVAYIYALAARPGRGIGKALMARAHRVLQDRGYHGVCLVPGEPWLEDYYRKMGYEGFGFARQDTFVPEGIARVTELTAEDYRQARDRFLKNAVLHSAGIYPFLRSFCGFYAGEDFLLCGSLEEGVLYIQEYLGACRNLPGILTGLGAKKAIFRQQKPMYLPLNAETALPGYFGIAMN